ncbi:MAG: hypothetical protein WCF78_03980 [archaeon]
MNKLNIVILVIVALLIGFVAGWLIFGMKSTTGNAKYTVSTEQIDRPIECGAGTLPHTCTCSNGLGGSGTCSTSKCMKTPDGDSIFDCSCCNKTAD